MYLLSLSHLCSQTLARQKYQNTANAILMPSLRSMSALLSRVNLHWSTSLSTVPGQTFKNVILVFSLYLCLLPVSMLLNTTEGLNSYLFLSLSLLAGAFLCFAAATLSHKLCALLKGVSWIGSQGMGSHGSPPQPSPGHGLLHLWFWQRAADDGSHFLHRCWETLRHV